MLPDLSRVVERRPDRTASGPRAPRGFVVLVALLATFLASSTVPTPFYASYASRWDLSSTEVTAAFGVYALTLLAALLVVGRLSDHAGRKPVLLVATALQVLAVVVLVGAQGYEGLLVGRVLQGLATGFGVGAISAAVLDVDARRGGVANAAAPLAGSALGGLIGAAAITALPEAGWVAYAVLLVALVVGAVLVARLPETSPRRAGALRSLRPSVALPPAARSRFAAAAPVLFAVYALSGLFASLGPVITSALVHSDAPLLGVLPLVVMNAAAPVTSVLLRHRPAPQVLAVGLAGLVLGVLLAAVGVHAGSAASFLLGAAVSGAGFGAGFRGGQQLIIDAVPDEEHAGAVSTVYVVSYVGFGVPAIAAGALDTATGDLEAVTLGYCAVLLVLAASAGLALARSARRERSTR